MKAVERDLRGLLPMPRAIDGHLILDERDVVAVFEVLSSLNPVTADSRDSEQAVRRLQTALDGLRDGERVQVIVDCGGYDPKMDIARMRA
ncbi:MAG: hypothetical protein ACREKE_01280, partial [bacterium]